MTHWTQPLGNARLNRHARRTLETTQQAQQLVAIARDTDAIIQRPTFGTPAGDERKLRGIPAIGRGVAGAIPGTSPHAAA